MVSLIGRGNRIPSTCWKPLTCHWQTLSPNVVSRTPPCTGFKLTTLVVIGNDCTTSCKLNYHAIRTTTASRLCISLISNIIWSCMLVSEFICQCLTWSQTHKPYHNTVCVLLWWTNHIYKEYHWSPTFKISGKGDPHSAVSVYIDVGFFFKPGVSAMHSFWN